MNQARQLIDVLMRLLVGCLVLLVISLVGFQAYHFLTMDEGLPGRPDGSS